MGQLLLLLVVALTVAAVVFGVTVLVTGRDPGLAPVEPDGRAVPLPGTRPLVETDVAEVRFDTTFRGYRMVQVDQAMRRAAYDIGYKDELIGVLEAEVTALREGRAAEADVLRRAREAAIAPERPEPETVPARAASGPVVSDPVTADTGPDPAAPQGAPDVTGSTAVGVPEPGTTPGARTEPARSGPAATGAAATEPAATGPARVEPAATPPATAASEARTDQQRVAADAEPIVAHPVPTAAGPTAAGPTAAEPATADPAGDPREQRSQPATNGVTVPSVRDDAEPAIDEGGIDSVTKAETPEDGRVSRPRPDQPKDDAERPHAAPTVDARAERP